MKKVWRSWGADAAVIVLLTAVVYLPSLRAGFVFDDPILITDNPMVKTRDGLYRYWFTAETSDYRPMAWSLWWVEWRLWGARAAGYHAVNILLHAVDAVLVWLVLRRLNPAPNAFWTRRGAWLAALIFAIHPVNVATAAWISEQKNTLSMLFFALSILLYLKFDNATDMEPVDTRERVPTNAMGPVGPRSCAAEWMWYGLSLAAGLLAQLTKTAVVMLPVVLLGCVWWRRQRVPRRDWWCSVPFFAASLILSLVTIVQHHRALPKSFVATGGPAARLAVAGYVPWFYLSKALLPIDLTVIYPKWEVDPARWISYVPGLIWLGLFVVFWWKRESWGRPVLFGLGYFVVMLFPVLGFFDQGFYSCTLVADHWQYYSIIGLIALAVAGGERIVRRIDGQRGYFGMAVAVAVLVALGAASWKRERVYADDETLWQDNVAKNPNAWLAQYDLGGDLKRSGRVQEAIEHYVQALRIRPDFAEAHSNLGSALAQLGRAPEAIAQYEQALKLKPNLAVVHYDYGVALEQTGRRQDAVRQYEEALRLNPGFPQAHFSLGLALKQAGRAEEAVAQYAEAVRLKPDYADAQINLGTALMQQGRTQEAIEHYEAALRIKPDNAEVHGNLGVLLAQLGRFQEAVDQYEQALRLKPDLIQAHYNLGLALSQLGRPADAIRQFEQVLRVKPDNSELHFNFGLALEHTGKVPEAISHYEEALRLKPDSVAAQNNLAWLLATLPPADGGDPARAVTLARRACELTGNREAPYLDTLAAAYAATGRFAEAVDTARKGVELARAAGQAQVASEIETHLALYREGHVYRR